MRRWLLILAALVIPGIALAQEDDPGLLARFLQDNLSDAGRQVTITGFQGALSSRATMAELTIADTEGIWLRLRGVTLDWNRAAVLRGRFSVNELSATEVIVVRTPVRAPGLPAPEAQGFTLPDLPVSVEIGKIAIARVEIAEAVLGQPVEASLEASARLVGGEGAATLLLQRYGAGPEGRVTLDASYSNQSRLLVLDLQAREGPGGIAATRLGLPGVPAAELSIVGQGIIDRFGAEIRLATDGVDRLSGRVTLDTEDNGDRRFGADLGGNPAPLFLPGYAAFFGEDVRLEVAGTRAASGALDLTRLTVRTQAMTLDGNLRTAPDGLPNRFALAGRIAAADGTPVLLPLSGEDTRVGAAEIALSYDASAAEGWSGRAVVQGLAREDVSIDQMLLTGSGRIRGGPQASVIGATLRFVVAGVQPADPALAAAVGEALTGQVKLAWQSGRPLNLSEMTLAGADYTIRTRGRLTGLSSGFGLDGTVTAEVADLARFAALAGRPLAGSAELTATAQGSLLGGDLDLEGRLAGEALRIGQAEIDALLAGRSQIDFSLARGAAGTEIRRLDLVASSLKIGVTGWLRSTGNDLSADLRFDDLAALGARYRGALTGQARATGTATKGALTLEARADGLGVGQPEADRLLRGQSTLSVALRREAGVVRVDRALLENPQVRIEALARATEEDRRVDLVARLADLGLLLPDFPGPLRFAGTIIDEVGGYRVDLRGTGPGQIEAEIGGRIASDGSGADLAIRGTAQAALANPFIRPRSAGGPLQFDLRLNGPFQVAALSGRVALTNGRVSAPLLGLSLQGVTAEAVLADGRATITADAAAQAGGAIGVRGLVGLMPPFEGDLTLLPRDMVLSDPNLYRTRVQGEVRINGPLAGGARISGAITLPETEIRVPSTGISGAGAIPDLTHRNEPAAVRATRARAGLIDQQDAQRAGLSRPYVLDLEINAPSRVFLRGRGLDAELGGALRLSGTTDAVIPSGEIALIRGRLDILGRRLDLSEAQLRLEGSLQPFLRVVASNASDGITSSVLIEGSISAPDISFTSVPELPEEEVLAHLLFGRQLTALSPFQALQLANAVATLAGRNGEGLIGTLRRTFKLDNLDVTSDGEGGTSVRVGRYIAKNLYTDVTVGTEGTTQLNLNLDVRPGVTLRGSADSEGSTGFGVFIERDY